MNDGLRAIVVLLVAVNPAASALAAAAAMPGVSMALRARRGAMAGGAALVIFAGLVLAADRILDFLDVAPETFRIAAGSVMVTSGLQAAWTARTPAEASSGWQSAVFPGAIPLLAGPAGLLAAMSLSADDGRGIAFLAAAIAVAAGAAAMGLGLGRWPAAAGAIGRLSGAALVVVGVALIVDGVQAV